MAATDTGFEHLESEARTALGQQLKDIRRAIVASGTKLVSWDELDREIAERRGERVDGQRKPQDFPGCA